MIQSVDLAVILVCVCLVTSCTICFPGVFDILLVGYNPDIKEAFIIAQYRSEQIFYFCKIRDKRRISDHV